MSFTKIATAGAGTMGSQVAWQMAFHGKHVIVYDAIPAGLEKGKAFHREYAEHFINQRGATRNQIENTFARLSYTADLAEAMRDADLISESVPESMPIKEAFWRDASRYAPAHTVFTTNTSTLSPSALSGSSTGRRIFSPCTLPSVFGTPTLARSWAIPRPTRTCSSAC